MKKIILKVIAIGFTLLIITFLFSIVNAFVGNPVSKAIASHEIKDYVKKNFSDMDLKLSKTSYNFKFSNYYTTAQSRTSKDTHFYLHYSRGKVLDTYETDVLSGWNTYQRLDDEFNHTVQRLIKDSMPYDYEMLFGTLDKKGKYKTMNLKLDMEFDYTNIPLDGYITAYINTEDVSWDNVAKITLEFDKLMKLSDIKIEQYDVILEPLSKKDNKTGESLGIYEFPQNLLAKENLPQVMKNYMEAWETAGDAKKNKEISNTIEKE